MERELHHQTRVLRHGDSFAVFDRRGDLPGVGPSGLYHKGTRFLSLLRLEIGDTEPLTLGSSISEDHTLFSVDLTNAELCTDDDRVLPADSLHLHRAKLLWQGRLYERVVVANHAAERVACTLRFVLDADFIDLFEARGARRTRRGVREDPAPEPPDGLRFGYLGLDGRLRRTRVRWRPEGRCPAPGAVSFALALAPRGEAVIDLEIECRLDERPAAAAVPAGFPAALQAARGAVASHAGRACRAHGSNELFNRWLSRSFADVSLMLTDTPSGTYPYAGVPWYSTPFGRDGIVTALEMLWVDDSIARGVLRCLAASQATHRGDEDDADPGKIVHELREGEMAALGEVPFGRYYGSVDATPLFLVLAGAYHRQTGDAELVEALWPSLEAALGWMDGPGDPDGDGFLEYASRTPEGLQQQGWRDAADSVFHADGRLAAPPIALAEVQGYAYAARLAVAELARARGDAALARAQEEAAARLKERFLARFWSEELGSFVLALDGDKQPCRVRGSSAGHCLWSGIVDPPRAARVARTLLGEAMFSGWGVRTIGRGEARYNPMSYHNGSVWPHDNALVAAGLARYGEKEGALRILDGLFEASRFVSLQRMPELLCGFDRRPGQGPTLYPVACVPQTWSAAAVFLLVKACLGLDVDAVGRRILFDRPRLPAWLDWLEVHGLAVREARVDLLFRRSRGTVAVELLRKEGEVELMVVKTF